MTQNRLKLGLIGKNMDLFSKELIKVNFPALDKDSLLMEMVDFLYEKHVISNKTVFLNAIMERESIMSTGIGKMVAIPHAYSEVVRKLSIAFFSLEKEIEFNSLDGLPVKVVFMIAVPMEMKKEYMNILASISNFLTNEENHSKLISAKSIDEIYNLLKGIKL